MEKYRSGHNEPDSKSGIPSGIAGSNPAFSANGDNVPSHANHVFVYNIFDD